MSVGDHFKVRAGVVLINNEEKILLARQNNKDFWVFPGGTQEIGEGMAECALREIKEETNLDVEIKQFLYLSDFMRKSRQSIDVVFLAQLCLNSAELIMETSENLNDLQWVSLKEMTSMLAQNKIKPEVLAQRVLDDWKTGFKAVSASYLGKYGL